MASINDEEAESMLKAKFDKIFGVENGEQIKCGDEMDKFYYANIRYIKDGDLDEVLKEDLVAIDALSELHMKNFITELEYNDGPFDYIPELKLSINIPEVTIDLAIPLNAVKAYIIHMAFENIWKGPGDLGPIWTTLDEVLKERAIEAGLASFDPFASSE